MNDKLDNPRDEIDRLDRQLLKTLSERIDIVRQICAVKGISPEVPLFDPVREQEVFEIWAREAEKLGLSRYYVGRVLREVLSYSRRIQENILTHKDLDEGRRVKIGFQGVTSSYSDLTIGKLFAFRDSGPIRRIGFRTFGAVVDALEAGEIDYGLLPVENTIAGSLNEVYMLLTDRPLHVIDEEVWEIEHCLVGRPGSSLSDIRVVRSHPVALQQCTRFLSALGCSTESFFDTAAAAESVASSSSMEMAAICSMDCAKRLGLNILREKIANQDDNITRFFLLSMQREPMDPRQPGKCSLIWTVNHEQGALANCLRAFAEQDISLTKIESRPLPNAPWEYLFYVDIEGHEEESHVKLAFEQVRRYTKRFKILGSYPRRTHRPGQKTEVGASKKPLQPETTASKPRPMTVPKTRTVHIGKVAVGGKAFVLMAGPCAVETREQMDEAARIVKDAGASVLRGGAFKPRTSPHSFQGLGFPGVELLAAAGSAQELPIVTEVLHVEDADRIAARADALQVGARNMQNFALLKKLGRLDKPIILKRGMSATLDELLHAAEYILAGGNNQVILCERGIRTFETATRSTLDVSAIPVLKGRTDLPVIVDPSHAAGKRSLVIPLALAAVACGADGLLVEVHPNPEAALCDGEQALTREDLITLRNSIDPIIRAQGRDWTS